MRLAPVSRRRPQACDLEVSRTTSAWPDPSVDRLNASIQRLAESLRGQPLGLYERNLPQLVAAEVVRRVRANLVVLLLDNGEGLMEVSGEVGLPPAERGMTVECDRELLRELVQAGVGVIQDTDRVDGALAGILCSRAKALVMVPLVHERTGFGVLMAGRHRSQTAVPTEVFTDLEVEALIGFAAAAAASLRTVVLLRRLRRQLEERDAR
jgi:hypothetical protein